LSLVAAYEARTILPAKYESDMRHIALATIAEVASLSDRHARHPAAAAASNRELASYACSSRLTSGTIVASHARVALPEGVRLHLVGERVETRGLSVIESTSASASVHD
jgi:hypothetical protein